MHNQDTQDAESTRLTITLPAEMMERAKLHATRRGSSIAQVIRDALYFHLKYAEREDPEEVA